MVNTERLLYQTEKSSYRMFSIKTFLKIFAIFTGKHLCEIYFFEEHYFEEHLRMVVSELILWNDRLEICFWIAFKTILTQ